MIKKMQDYSHLREFVNGVKASSTFYTRVANTNFDIEISKTMLLTIALVKGVEDLLITPFPNGNFGFYWSK